MNSTIAKMLSKIPGAENLLERLPGRIGHEPTPRKKFRQTNSKPTNKQKMLAERKEKKRRRMEFKSRRVNRLRGVG